MDKNWYPMEWNPEYSFSRTFVHTRFLTGPDVRAHIKWPPQTFIHQSNYHPGRYLVKEHPGWSNKWCTNVQGGHLISVRMSGVVIWYVHERLDLSKIACEWMYVWTNIRTLMEWNAMQNIIWCQFWHYLCVWLNIFWPYRQLTLNNVCEII